MPSIKKMYHRGNDDKKEGNYLTAIFHIELSADTSTCCWVKDRGGASVCLGLVIFKFDIMIKSPADEGKGNANARDNAVRYGIESFGQFIKFKDDTAKDARAEEWKITQTVYTIPIQCMGGAYKGKLNIQIDSKEKRFIKRNPGSVGIAYSIIYSVSVEACGKVKMDFELKQEEKAFGIDGGEPDMEVRKRALKEVKKGDKPPFGLKTEFPAPDDREISETGEIIKKTVPSKKLIPGKG